MRAARAISCCAAGLELIATANLSRIPRLRSPALLVEIGFETAVNFLGHFLQSQFAQRNQGSRTEKIRERLLHPVERINIAAPHAGLQRLRSEVRHDHFPHPLHHPVGNSLPHRDAADSLHAGSDTLQVLDIHGRQDADVGVHQLQNVFVAFVVPAAFDVGVGQFVDQHHRRFAGQNCVEVHFLEDRALVFEFLSGDGFEFLGQFNHAFAAVGLDDADDHIFAAALAPDGLAQHVVGFSHAGRVSEKQLERAAFFFGRGFFKPLLWSLGHCRLLSWTAFDLSISATIA